MVGLVTETDGPADLRGPALPLEERGGLAQRSLPCAMRRLAYSDLFLMPSMALMAFEMFVKLTKAQFLRHVVTTE